MAAQGVGAGTWGSHLRAAVSAATVRRSRAASDPRVVLFALLVLALALRLGALGESFWYDESYTAYIVAQRPLHALELIPATESTPPLYYAIAWLWVQLFGGGEVALRSLSLVAGLGTVYVLYLLGRELAPAGRERAAAAACGLAGASSPLLAWYASEARAYALFAVWCALATLLFARALREPSGRRLWWYGATAAAALATHYFAVFVIGPQLVLLLVRLRWRGAWRALALPAASGLALAPLALAQLGSRRTDWITESPLAERAWHALVHFAAGFKPPLVPALLALLLFWGGVGAVALRPPGDLDPRARTVALLALAGIGSSLVLALLGLDRVLTRNLLGSWPLLAVPAAVAALAATGRARRAAVAALAVWCALSGLLTARIGSHPWLRRPDWREAARFVASGNRPQLVLVPAYPHLLPLRIYLPKLRRAPARHVAYREIDLIVPRGSGGDGCWWGALCNLPRAPLPRRQPAGFRPALVRSAHGLVYERLLPTRRGVEVSAQEALRVLAPPGPNGAFWQRGAVNARRSHPGSKDRAGRRRA